MNESPARAAMIGPPSVHPRTRRAHQRPGPRLSVVGILAFAGLLGACGATGTPVPPSSGAAGSASAEASQTLEFEPVTLQGTGNGRRDFSVPEGSAALAAMSNHGSGPFTVRTIGAGGDPGQLLVDWAGDYTGLVLFDARIGQHSVAFDVRSMGSWTIRVEPVGLAPSWSGDLPFSGTGDDVAVLDAPADGTTTIVVEHPGAGPFAVYAYTTSGDLDQLAQASGPVAEAHDLPAGTVCLEVRAVGRWTLSPG